MDKQTKKRIKIVLIGFCVLIIPISYWMYSSIVFERANQAFNEAQFSEDSEIIEKSIAEIAKALKVKPWDKILKSMISTLHLKNGDYYYALDFALKNNAYLYSGMIYEYLEKPDSAKIYYKLAVEQYKKQLNKLKEIEIKLQVERQISLIYTFIEDTLMAKKYLNDIPPEIDYQMRKMIMQYDYYIENYSKGGYKDFLYGEIICMKNDSISDSYVIDSLLEANRFYYEEYFLEKIENQKEKAIFKFKKIFQDKAQRIGFIETICE